MTTTTTRPTRKTAGQRAAVGTSRTNHRSHMVPTEELLEMYVNRTVEGGVTDFRMMELGFRRHWPVLISGPTGCGKTMMIKAFAAKMRLPFKSISCNAGAEPSQFFGRVIPLEDGTFAWQDGAVTDFARHGGIILFNEINFLPERISTSLFSLLDGGRSITVLDHKAEKVEGHPKLMVVADMNPEYLGTRPLNAAFQNRFPIQSVWDYDDTVESELVKNKEVLDLGKKLRLDRNILTPVSTNMLQELEASTHLLNWPFGKANFVNHFAADERAVVQQVIDTMEDNIKAGMKTKDRAAVVARANKGFRVSKGTS